MPSPDTTTNLAMPFILPAQAQKHVIHNEALLVLDAVVQLTIAAATATPPASPVAGRCYLVADGAAGEWTGRDGRLAAWQDGAWTYLIPLPGWRAWFEEVGRLKIFDGTNWQEIGLPEEGQLERLGINATPDATNRLAIASPASLFSHDGAGHQVKINKAAATDTASLLFQSNWTGYAEMGLAGDTSFSIKVSDGTTWTTAIEIDVAGHVSRPRQPSARASRPGTNFSFVDGQQSGFTVLDLNQGGFALGAAVAGGGNTIVIPATGIYLLSLTTSILSSSGHSLALMRNGADTIAAMTGASGVAQTQNICVAASLSAGDFISLSHSGTATIELAATRTFLSIVMV